MPAKPSEAAPTAVRTQVNQKYGRRATTSAFLFSVHTLFKDSLRDKVALVTGAGSGIGKATAKLFGYCGARVAVLTRSREEAEATCMEIRRSDGEAIGIVADISDAGQLAKGFQTIDDTWG